VNRRSRARITRPAISVAIDVNAVPQGSVEDGFLREPNSRGREHRCEMLDRHRRRRLPTQHVKDGLVESGSTGEVVSHQLRVQPKIQVKRPRYAAHQKAAIIAAAPIVR
jgi:hypothetical protein